MNKTSNVDAAEAPTKSSVTAVVGIVAWTTVCCCFNTATWAAGWLSISRLLFSCLVRAAVNLPPLTLIKNCKVSWKLANTRSLSINTGMYVCVCVCLSVYVCNALDTQTTVYADHTQSTQYRPHTCRYVAVTSGNSFVHLPFTVIAASLQVLPKYDISSQILDTLGQ